MRLALLALALLAAATPAAAQPWRLERRFAPGTRVRVDEVTRTEHRGRYQQAGAAATGEAEVQLWERRYVEEVRSAQPEVLHRAYEASTRAKHHPQAAPNPERTSLHGKGVLVSGLELRPEAPTFEVSKDDREGVRFDRLAAAMLPAQPVGRGDKWVIPGEALTRALWGEYLTPAGPDCQARVELKQVKEEKGKTHATVRVRALVRTTRTDTLPDVSLQLTGDLKWCVEDGLLLEGRLEGPVAYGAFFEKDGQRAEWRAEGTTTWTYRAEVLEARAAVTDADRRTGLPPPPGTTALVCEHDATHRYELAELVRCIQCGKALDATTRRCPDKHPWPLQYCPRDGAPLKPQP